MTEFVDTQQFSDLLKCSVCLDQYTDPRILQCHHSFCFTCIQGLPTIEKNGIDHISCPTCRGYHPLPKDGGVTKIQSDFKTNEYLKLIPKEKMDKILSQDLDAREKNVMPQEKQLTEETNTHSQKHKIGEQNYEFVPTATRGEHLLMLQMGGANTSGVRPVMIINRVNNPSDIAVSANGEIVVAEYTGNCITVFNRKGEKIRSIKDTKLGEINRPRGVAVSNDTHILVTNDHKLQKLTFDGVCVQSVGSNINGNRSLEFDCPSRIAVHPTTGEVFVADFRNHRIQVFNGVDLSFSHTITHDNIRQPCDVAVDSHGYLFTIGNFSQNVYKFTTTGQYIETIATTDNSNVNIMYFAIHSKNIYFTDTDNHQVLLFDTNEKQLYTFGKKGRGEGEFDRPRGIAVDTSGNVYVCDGLNNRIVVH